LLGATDHEVEEIAGIVKETLELFTQHGDGRNYSLLSKWLHFCFPDTFAIYDSHAAHSIEVISRAIPLTSAGVHSTQFLQDTISNTSGGGYRGLLNFYRLFWDAAGGLTRQIQRESHEIQSLLRQEAGCPSARVTPFTLVDMLLWMSNGSQEDLGLAAVVPVQVIDGQRTKGDANELRSESKGRKPSVDSRSPGALGSLRIADDAHEPTTLFIGHVVCPHCSTSIDIEIERNPSAVSAKQPAFMINKAGRTPGDRSIGQLFIGTILTSPVLYYGSITHCGAEQRISVFFNRALRNSADHHLTIMRSTSGNAGTSSANNEKRAASK
jgi:hypothetical protein